MTSRKHMAFWWFLAPALTLLVGFLAYPLGRSLYLSLHKTAGPEHSVFVGFDNYLFVMSDGYFWAALVNSLVFAVVFVGLKLGLALLLALVLEARRTWTSGCVRMLLFIPHLVGAVFAATIVGKLLHKSGPIHHMFGFHTPFLENPQTAMAVIIVVSLWLAVGYAVVYLQAALQSVDRSQWEAAMLDGAGPIQRFRVVIWPAVRPTVGLLALVGLIAALQIFELPYLLTRGGPGTSTLTMGLYLYQQGFEQGSLGYAAAVGWLMAVVVGLTGMLMMRQGAGRAF